MHTRAPAITDAILHAAHSAIPLKATLKKPKPLWWNQSLERIRKSLKAAARLRYDPTVIDAGRLYIKARNRYTTALRASKIQSWRSHCTKNGRKALGKLYYRVKNGSRTTDTPTFYKTLQRLNHYFYYRYGIALNGYLNPQCTTP